MPGAVVSAISRRFRMLGIFLVAVALLLAAAGCSGAGGPTATPTPTPKPVDPREELQRTVETLTALQSVEFDLEHLVGSTNLLPGVLMNRAYGKAVVPGQFDITVEGELLFPRSYMEIGMVSLGEQAYMTNLVNGQWEEVSLDALPINLSDFGATLADIVDRVQSPQMLGRDSIDGADVYHIGGDITSEALKGLVPTAGTGFPVALEMWTERDTGMLRKALITGQVVVTDLPEAERQLTLTGANQPVTIEPPEL